jgi:hypothetical protein
MQRVLKIETHSRNIPKNVFQIGQEMQAHHAGNASNDKSQEYSGKGGP